MNWTESPRFAGGPGPVTAYRGSQLLNLTTFHSTLGGGFDSESRIQPSTDGPSCAPNGRHDRSSQSAPFSSSCSGGGFANVDGSVCPLP